MLHEAGRNLAMMTGGTLAIVPMYHQPESFPAPLVAKDVEPPAPVRDAPSPPAPPMGPRAVAHTPQTRTQRRGAWKDRRRDELEHAPPPARLPVTLSRDEHQ